MSLIACIQIPDLAIAVARQTDPALATVPLLLYQPGAQATVYSAAPETRVPIGLPLRQALLRVPQAVCRPAAPARDQALYAALTSLLSSFSPRVAADALLPHATVEIDLGRVRLPRALALAEQIGAAIRAKLGLVPALGLARTRFVAGVAASTAGAGVAVLVPPEREAHFLAPLSIAVLPLDQEIARRLDLLGLRTVGAVAALPLDALQVQFGVRGQALHRFAHGLDNRPISTTRDAATIQVERWFAGPLADRHLLEQALGELATDLAGQLLTGGWAAQDVSLTVAFESGDPWTERHTLVQPTVDPATLAQALVALLGQARGDGGVEQLHVASTQLRPTAAMQLGLFAPLQGQADRLDDIVQRLSARYAGCFVQATVTDRAYLPEQRVRFDPISPP